MDIDRLNKCSDFLKGLTRRPTPLNCGDVKNVRNYIISIANDIKKEQPVLSGRLKKLNNELVIRSVPCIQMNAFKVGRILEILDIMSEQQQNGITALWEHIHPRIIKVSQGLYLDGHYANAAEDAFIEVNDYLKKIYQKLNPDEENIPDGVDLMHKIMGEKNANFLRVGNPSTETGRNIQQGYHFMLAGAMSALRNPKAHSNDEKLSAEEAMRRLMFASMLMYKIDEAVKNQCQ